MAVKEGGEVVCTECINDFLAASRYEERDNRIGPSSSAIANRRVELSPDYTSY